LNHDLQHPRLAVYQANPRPYKIIKVNGIIF